ncbi:MAG: hypothetical protein AAF548_06850 [Actinomycetota bacterium]
MAGFCAGPCTYPFRGFNKFFGSGVPFQIAHAFHGDPGDSTKGEWNADATGAIGTDTMDHFQEHWLGGAWCSPQEGEHMFSTFVSAIQQAGVRPLNAIWVEGKDPEATSTTVHDLGSSVLVVVRSPRFREAGPAHTPACVN